MQNQNRFVVVENPGTDNQDIVISFMKLETAIKWVSNHKKDWPNVDIMRRLNDGTLITEI